MGEFKPADTIVSQYDQILDPNSSEDKRTFKQRYFINSDLATGTDSPVFYMMCGEGACDGGGFYGAVLDEAKLVHAHLVALEHRYYGESQPFDEMTAENLKYLKTEYALADMARFQDYISAEKGWTGPWVAIGGSYSGSLAAYYRLKNPKKVVGSLASSAPVEAKANFEEYDADVAATAGPECAKAIRGVVSQVQATFNDPVKLAEMKHLFGADEIRNNIDFIYTLADMAATAVQYGKRDEFCSALLAGDPLQAYAKEGKAMFKWFGTNTVEDSFQGCESTKTSDYTKGVGARQWLWQSCTEFGYFQVANSDPARSVRSNLITLDFHYQMCDQLFGLDKPVDTDKNNKEFFLPLFKPAQQAGASQIFFTNGSTDPWQYLSITKERKNNVNPLFSYLTLDGGSHCSDLGSSSLPAVLQAKQEFEGLLGKWLAQ